MATSSSDSRSLHHREAGLLPHLGGHVAGRAPHRPGHLGQAQPVGIAAVDDLEHLLHQGRDVGGQALLLAGPPEDVEQHQLEQELGRELVGRPALLQLAVDGLQPIGHPGQHLLGQAELAPGHAPDALEAQPLRAPELHPQEAPRVGHRVGGELGHPAAHLREPARVVGLSRRHQVDVARPQLQRTPGDPDHPRALVHQQQGEEVVGVRPLQVHRGADLPPEHGDGEGVVPPRPPTDARDPRGARVGVGARAGHGSP
jgi:hypothetical protein